MKYITLAAILAAASLVSAHADLTVDAPGYSVQTYYTEPESGGSPNPNNIVSFDWDASDNLYYQSATPGYSFGGLYESSGGNTTTIAAANTDYPGASVVSIGSSIYYNTSSSTDGTQKIYLYNSTVGGSPTLTSTNANFGLYGHAGQLFITGAPSGTNHIYQTALNADGSFASSPPKDLGADSGSSGPLAFDAAGNLYYAPGYGDQSIYRWTAMQVAAAIADPAGNPLATPAPWASYGTNPAYDSYPGGTALLVDGNQLLVTLTNFGSPAELVAFGIGSGATSTDNGTTLLTGDSLGDLRLHDGDVFVSNGNSIYQVNGAPEPSAALLFLAGLGLLFAYRWRRTLSLRGLGLFAVLLATSAGAAWAGPFSPAADQPNSNGISADAPGLQWATGVVSFNPGPVDITKPNGAVADYGVPSNALGKADASQNDPSPVVSLGDGGSITLSFATPIANGPGADLAVFENGFPQGNSSTNYFLELATVSVSSDGLNFFTFPSISLTPTTTQITAYGTLDPTNVYNLAGAEIAGYGTPFNLDDLTGVSGLNINAITQVRITDVIGQVDTSHGKGTYTTDDATNPIFKGAYTTDHVINDPFDTTFASGGFDLDAVGVIHTAPEPSTWACLTAGLLLLLGAGWKRRRRV